MRHVALAFALSLLASSALAAGTQTTTINSTTFTDLGAAPVAVQTLNQPVNVCIADAQPSPGTQCYALQPGLLTAFNPADSSSHVWAAQLGAVTVVTYAPVYAINSGGGSVTQGTSPWVISGTVTPSNTSAAPLYVGVVDGTNGPAAVKAPSTAPVASDKAVVVAISPNSVNANGQATMANSSPVVIASNQSNVPTYNGANIYNTIAASQTAQIMSVTSGGTSGTTGDYLSHCTIVPATTAPGVVTILDNSTAIYSFPGGGTTALTTLIPFSIPIGAKSVSGAWKVTTGANVSVVCVGKFT